MALTLVTATTSTAVTLTEAKAHLRVEISDDDTLITDMIEAAEAMAEAATNRQLMTATWDWKLDYFPRVLKVPKPPLQSVTSVKYTDTNGVEQTVDSSVYIVDTDSQPGRIILDPDQTWPAPRIVEHAVTVRFVAGYADSGASPAVPNDQVPEVIKRWILLQVANMYEMREEWITGTIATRLPFADRQLAALKVPMFS